jgi:tRNA modification GTPase
VAIATPIGRGGIGVIRVSGPEALSIVLRLTDRIGLQVRQATFARVLADDEDEARPLDHAVVTWFEAPHSYTGDDVVEISTHGSPAVLDEVVAAVVRLGARLAEPGEFTLRAYLNGRIDLVQAEAVADLVDAVTPRQARVAVDQLEGTLSGRVSAIDQRLFDLVAKLEASLDFPEEGYHFVRQAEVVDELSAVQAELSALLADGRRGRLVREGWLVVIAGRPNVGKSSLFNRLVGTGRAIVTPIAGTTRDVLTEVVDVEGIPLTLVDTAGVREAGDDIEAEGVRRAVEAVGAAALTLVVVDGSAPATSEDEDVLRSITSPHVVVRNKHDRGMLPAWESLTTDVRGRAGIVDVSASTGSGLGELRRLIAVSLAGSDMLRDTPGISNQRHLGCAERAAASVSNAVAAVEAGGTEEVVLAELGDARIALEEMTGRRTPEDVLTHIFSHFCIGK